MNIFFIKSYINKNDLPSRHRWFTPAILAQQAEISRIMVRSQPGQTVDKTPPQKKKKKKPSQERLKA
jgi:hypothetical protein